jgi:hypothetical protein
MSQSLIGQRTRGNGKMNPNATNGHHLASANGNGHRPYTNGNDPDVLARLAKLDRIEAKREAWKGRLGLAACVIIALVLGGGFYYDVTHLHTPPDPYIAIETQIDNIDLDQPKHDVREQLNELKSAVEDLRPDNETDQTDRYGGA